MDIRTEIAELNNPSVQALLSDIVPDKYLNPEDSLVLLALSGDDVLGYLLFRSERACIVITSLYVFEEYRRKGVASFLLDSFGMLMWNEEYHYPVLMYISDIEGSEGLLELMKGRIDYQVTPACGFIQVSYKQIQGSKTLQEILTSAKKELSLLFDIPSSVRKKEYSANRKKHAYIGDGLISNGTGYCKDLCFCDYHGGKLLSFALVKSLDEKTLNLEYMFSKDVKSSVELLRSIGEKILKDYEGCSLTVSAVNDSSHKLVDRFFKERTSYEQYRARWNGLVWSELEELI